MTIDTTVLLSDVQEILQSGLKNVFFKWRCEIIVGDNRFTPMKVISAPLKRDYQVNVADQLELTVMIKEYEYDYITQADDDRLEVILYKEPQQSNSTATNMYLVPSTQRFKAVVNYKGVDRPKPKTGQKLSTPDIENSGEQMKELVLSAFDLVAETIRLNEVGLTGRNKNPLLFVRAIVGKESKKVSGGEIAVRGVDIIEPSNTEVRQHIPIPDGVPLQDLPGYVQKLCGIYNAGIGFYLQSGLWYIYPLYDVTRYNKTERNLTVFNVNTNRFPSAESSFKVYGKALKIVNTGKFSFFDNREYDYLNVGNGSRFTTCADISENFGTYNNGKYTIKRKENNTEAVLENKRTGMNYAPVSSQRFTSNPFVELSALAQRECSYAAFEWQNATDEIIYPGMPCKIYFLSQNDEVKETTGTVLGVEYFYELAGNRLTDPRYICNAVVKLALRRIL